jgi:pimeloyl-ACP methyl ester carboxylesterase
VIFYLHGFASSPQSSKAEFFRERLLAHGLPLSSPDFNLPEFRTLTMTRMLSQLDDAIAKTSGPATLIGSSLGGTLAILAASRMPDRVQQVVLLAPFVMFARPGHDLLPPERMQEWRERGTLPVFHYASGEERLLDYTFYEDSLAFDAFGATFEQPALIFQGRQDGSVDCSSVEAFAQAHPRTALCLLDDDHSLHASLPQIWRDAAPFLGLVD